MPRDEIYQPEQRVLQIAYNCRQCFEENLRARNENPTDYPNGGYFLSTLKNLAEAETVVKNGGRTVVCERGHEARVTDDFTRLKNRLRQAKSDPPSRFRIY